MRNVPPNEILREALDAILADLKETLAALPRPAALIEAESRVLQARETRANLWETYRGLIKDMTRSLSRDSAAEAGVHGARRDLDKAEAEVDRAQKALNRLREVQIARIAGAIERHRTAAAAAVAGAAAIFAAGEAAAAKEHGALPDCVPYSPDIDGMIVASYRTAQRQRNAADRKFDRAAAAMVARAAPPQPTAGPLKWKAKMTDFGGGTVDDGSTAVRPTPGANHTTQKIPQAAGASVGSFGLAASSIFGRKRT